MRGFARSHPALASAFAGAAVGLLALTVGGGVSGGWVNLALAVVLGAVFGGSMFAASVGVGGRKRP